MSVKATNSLEENYLKLKQTQTFQSFLFCLIKKKHFEGGRDVTETWDVAYNFSRPGNHPKLLNSLKETCRRLLQGQ